MNKDKPIHPDPMTKEEAREILIQYNAYRRGGANSPMPNPTEAGQAIDVAIRALGDGIKLNDWQKGWLSFNQIDVDLVEKILNSTEPPKS